MELPTAPNRLDVIRGTQLGLFTKQQARACGYSAYQVRRRLSSGEWRLALGTGSVLTYRDRPVSDELRATAIHLSVAGSVLAGPSAARCHGIAAPAEPIYLWTPRPVCLPGVHGFRDPLSPNDIHRVGGLQITTLARTIFDCLRVLDQRNAASFLDRALRQRWITLPGLTDRICAHAGRRDAPHLVALIRAVTATRIPDTSYAR